MNNLGSSADCLWPSLLCAAQNQETAWFWPQSSFIWLCVSEVLPSLVPFEEQASRTWAPPRSQFTNMFTKCASGTILNASCPAWWPSPSPWGGCDSFNLQNPGRTLAVTTTCRLYVGCSPADKPLPDRPLTLGLAVAFQRKWLSKGELTFSCSDDMPALLEGEYLGMVRGWLGSTRERGIRSVLRVFGLHVGVKVYPGQ